MAQPIFNRKLILSMFNEPEVFDGLLKREQRGAYNLTTGEVSMQRFAFKCRVIPNSRSVTSIKLSYLEEIQRAGGKVLTALTTTKINYDQNWLQLSTEEAVPPVPEKDDQLEYNNRLYKITAVLSRDMEAGVLYELMLSGA